MTLQILGINTNYKPVKHCVRKVFNALLLFADSDSSDDSYEADEEDTQEVGYASEPANIIRVSIQHGFLFLFGLPIFSKKFMSMI